MGRRALTLATVFAALVGPAVAVAVADAVPGATYAGQATAWDGTLATIRLVVSQDGTLVDGYQVDGDGKNANGGVCSVSTGESDQMGFWSGAPITRGNFSNTAAGGTITGHFDAAQGASGTFRYSTPDCDTGTLHWTATTNSPVPTNGTSSTGAGTTTGATTGNGGSSASSGSQSSRHQPTAVTRVRLRRVGGILIGTLVSPQPRCKAGRTVVLWRGTRRLRTLRSTRTGHFSVAVPRDLVGRSVRASVFAKSTRRVGCLAGSSPFIAA